MQLSGDHLRPRLEEIITLNAINRQQFLIFSSEKPKVWGDTRNVALSLHMHVPAMQHRQVFADLMQLPETYFVQNATNTWSGVARS